MPVLQRLVAGMTANVPPLLLPQTPLTGLTAKLAVMVMLLITLARVNGLADVVTKPPVPVQLTKL